MTDYQQILSFEKEKQGIITFLDLSNLQLSYIPNEIFNLQELEVFIFRNNLLEEIPIQFFELQKLKEIDFKNNKINFLPADIQYLTKIEKINLNDNQIRFLPTQIKELTFLKELFLANNLLEEIPVEIGNLYHLENLNLRNNELTNLPLSIRDLLNLKFLQIENNQLMLVPSSIFKLPYLCHFIWKKQKTQITPIKADSFDEIEKIVFANKYLYEIPSFVFQCVNLKTLILTENEISQIPPEIGNLTKLEILDIQTNLIYDLPNEFFELKNLTHFYCSRNEFMYYPLELLKLEKLQSFVFYDNFFTREKVKVFDNQEITANDLTTQIVKIIQYTKGLNFSFETKKNLLALSIDSLTQYSAIPIDDYFEALSLNDWNIFYNASNYLVNVMTNYKNPSKFSTIGFCGDTTFLDKSDYIERLQKLNIQISNEIEKCTHLVLLFPSQKVSLRPNSNIIFMNERLLNHFLNQQEAKYLQRTESAQEQKHIISLLNSKQEENIDIAITLLFSLGVSYDMLYHLVYGLFFYQKTYRNFEQFSQLIYLYGSENLYKNIKQIPDNQFRSWNFDNLIQNICANTELKYSIFRNLNK